MKLIVLYYLLLNATYIFGNYYLNGKVEPYMLYDLVLQCEVQMFLSLLSFMMYLGTRLTNNDNFTTAYDTNLSAHPQYTGDNTHSTQRRQHKS